MWLGAAAVGVVVAVGVGWLVWPESGRPKPVPGTVQANVLSQEEVSKVVGTTLTAETGISEPPPALIVDPTTCEVAAGPATQSVYAAGWTVFWSVTAQDMDDVADHAVTQVLGVYPDREKAGAVFRTLAEGVGKCKWAMRSDDEDSTKWNYKVGTETSDALSWTATQDAGEGWACYREARLKGNTVLQVAVCQAGDGQASAAKIADQVAGRVGG
ncbi:PknH-like protein [Actinocrispum wychmicini]|uniref:PknH-like protein n=1 Tax=Actinocrispum wychmicini TaxID=1213861 RepID=A0A4R2IRA2_9PSEU|nr:PknH-like protein [Actinocrispum wychmicini]